jgi:hypothetical protein
MAPRSASIIGVVATRGEGDGCGHGKNTDVRIE